MDEADTVFFRGIVTVSTRSSHVGVVSVKQAGVEAVHNMSKLTIMFSSFNHAL